ncbi:epoxide hydrolase family protein [Aureimonas glaciei]|uniref:Multidrug MFS transporter n=1 Tax=Aureimonas glaciei TaxID=1776957 RepID=A0A917DCK2_9HYPH|nr:epoxide hydrolase family protein [Aureimonas glaciei]GGD26054.1 multidrug MFS transporter [Aureimonas glaciei]
MDRRQFIHSLATAAGIALVPGMARAASREPASPAIGASGAKGTLVRPFRLAVPQADLDDLQSRLARTRWPDRETVDDTSQGPPLEDVRALVERWRDGYDWRACERLLNSSGQHVTEIDGLDIHFLHVRSPEPNAVPLLLTHGWPGSVLEFRHVIGPLTDPVAHGGQASDAFHVVVPSLPGHGFSEKPTGVGWNNERIAKAWIVLMERLGYERWAAQGGDRGAQIATRLGFMKPPGLIGIHLNLVEFELTDAEKASATPDERKMLEDLQFYVDRLSGYAQIHSRHPQSVAYGLADSPAGLAAWIYQMLQDVSDSDGHPERVFTLDGMIDNVMLYWLSNAGASSARLYWETARETPRIATIDEPMPTPTGISMFPGEKLRLSKRWAEPRFANLVHFNEVAEGGHFAAWEQPTAFVNEVRRTFRGLR